MSTFRPYEPDQHLLLPPSLRDWLPEDHLAQTICRFCEEHLAAFQNLFVQVVQIAYGAGLVTMGTLAVDGSKIRANASKRKAMSYDRMQQEEERLAKEIQALTDRAANRDSAEDVEFGPDFRGDELPEELKRREDRLAKIREAKERLEARKREEAKAAGPETDDQPEDKDPPPRRGRPRKYPLGEPKPKDTVRMDQACSGMAAVQPPGDSQGQRRVQPGLPRSEPQTNGGSDEIDLIEPASAPRGRQRPSGGPARLDPPAGAILTLWPRLPARSLRHSAEAARIRPKGVL